MSFRWPHHAASAADRQGGKGPGETLSGATHYVNFDSRLVMFEKLYRDS